MDSQLPDGVKQRRNRRERSRSMSKGIGDEEETSPAAPPATSGQRRGSAGNGTEEARRERRRPRRRAANDTDSRTVSSKDSSGSREKSSRSQKSSGASVGSTKSRRKKTAHSGTLDAAISGNRTPSSSSRRRSKSGESSDDTFGQDTEEENESSSDEEGEPKATASADFGAAFGDTGTSAAFGDADAFGSTDTGNANGNDTAFEAGFGSFPTDFESFPAAVTTPVTAAEDDDSQPPSFGFPALAPPPAPKPLYDTSPLDNPPTLVQPSVNISLANPRPILMQSSMPAPVADPQTGHLILCRKNTKGDFTLLEWNPHTKAQVLSVPILSLDLQRKVAAKYGVSAAAVDTVLTLAVGVHQAHGYARTRVACLMDLMVLDNHEVLRVIAVWQWGYASSHHPIQLQTIMSPPSGSDFSYNTESLLISDSCVFVSGASAKGPCVFLCKPTIRETWSANFVGKEAARIASMAVTTTLVMEDKKPTRLPYLAIALTDGSLNLWTYESATTMSSKTTEGLRRLLFPLCRLEGVKILRECQPTAWSTKDRNLAAGKE
jgi:hypothetical protein